MEKSVSCLGFSTYLSVKKIIKSDYSVHFRKSKFIWKTSVGCGVSEISWAHEMNSRNFFTILSWTVGFEEKRTEKEYGLSFGLVDMRSRAFRRI